MAKKNTKIKEKVITLKIKESELNRIDAYATKLRINRSQLLRNLIDTSLEDLDLMNSTGLLTMAIKGIDLLDIIKKALSKKNYRVEKDNRLIIDF